MQPREDTDVVVVVYYWLEDLAYAMSTHGWPQTAVDLIEQRHSFISEMKHN